MRRKQSLAFTITIISIIGIVNVYGEEEKVVPRDDTAKKIIEFFKDNVVDVKTTLTVAEGARFESQKDLYAEKICVTTGRATKRLIEMTVRDARTLEFGGSAFFIDADGYLLTAAHVVKVPNDELEVGFMFGSQKLKIASYTYWVTLAAKQKKYRARLIGLNEPADVALLKIDGADSREFNVAKLGDRTRIKEGDTVYAVGSPHGLSATLTDGIVSYVGRYIDLNYLEDFIQTSAPINPGNSGCPLINLNLEVIGICDAKIHGADGLGFAISTKLIDIARLKRGNIILNWFGLEALIKNFDRTGTYDQPGFQDVKFLNEVTEIDSLETLTTLAKISKEHWAIANLIDETPSKDGRVSPAKKKDFRKGDLIIKVNGKDVRSGMDMRLALLDIPTGQNFDIEFIRVDKGARTQTTITTQIEKKKE